jgi:hypothetical protein
MVGTVKIAPLHPRRPKQEEGMIVEKRKTLSELLFEEADREDGGGDQYEGCSFMGVHPSTPHRERASLLRMAGLAALQQEIKVVEPKRGKSA